MASPKYKVLVEFSIQIVFFRFDRRGGSWFGGFVQIIVRLEKGSMNTTRRAFASDGMAGNEETFTHDDIEHGEFSAAGRILTEFRLRGRGDEVGALKTERRCFNWLGVLAHNLDSGCSCIRRWISFIA